MPSVRLPSLTDGSNSPGLHGRVELAHRALEPRRVDAQPLGELAAACPRRRAWRRAPRSRSCAASPRCWRRRSARRCPAAGAAPRRRTWRRCSCGSRRPRRGSARRRALTTMPDRIRLAREAVGELEVAGRRRARVPLDRVAAAPVPVRPGRRGRARRAAPRRCCAACRAPSPRPSSGRGRRRASAGWTRSRPPPGPRRRRAAPRRRATTPPAHERRSPARRARTSMPARSAAARCWAISPSPPSTDADREPAPEAVAAVLLVGLALVHEPEADAAPVQPAHGLAGVLGEDPRHRLVAAAEREPPQVGEEVVRGVRVEVGRRRARSSSSRMSRRSSTPAVREADRARRERGVAARPRARRLLEHEHARAPLARGVRGAHAGVAGSDDDDVPRRCGDTRRRSPGNRAPGDGYACRHRGSARRCRDRGDRAARRRRGRRRVRAVPHPPGPDHGAGRARRRLGQRPRARSRRRRATRKLDDGVEVYNVEGAGGTLGLSQLVSKDAGDPYELMMTGLVMLGAIETNQSDVTLDATTPIATLITEAEAIVVPAKSKYQTLKDLDGRPQERPGLRARRRRLGRQHRPAAARRAHAHARRRPAQDASTSPTPAAARRTPRSSPARSTPA